MTGWYQSDIPCRATRAQLRENVIPILNVKASGERNPELARKIANTLIDLTSRILKKDPRVTAIAIDFVPRDQWIVGGETLAALGKNSIYFDVKITDETNTKEEKERYIREAFDAFKTLLGELHEHSYIHVQDVRAAAYGFGGRTQEYRYQHRRAVRS